MLCDELTLFIRTSPNACKSCWELISFSFFIIAHIVTEKNVSVENYSGEVCRHSLLWGLRLLEKTAGFEHLRLARHFFDFFYLRNTVTVVDWAIFKRYFNNFLKWWYVWFLKYFKVLFKTVASTRARDVPTHLFDVILMLTSLIYVDFVLKSETKVRRIFSPALKLSEMDEERIRSENKFWKITSLTLFYMLVKYEKYFLIILIWCKFHSNKSSR